jgi:hypothetical protein
MALFEDFPDWKPVSRLAGIAWLVFCLLFLLYAVLDTNGFLIIDYANLLIHEAGHMVFSPFGYTITILGGTLLELIVPFLCAAGFSWKRETTAVAFCAVWFFENFLYIGTYMSDARTAARPLVGSDESDWTILFTQWGVLVHDQQIGQTMRDLGYLGMLAAMAWLGFRVYRDSRISEARVIA